MRTDRKLGALASVRDFVSGIVASLNFSSTIYRPVAIEVLHGNAGKPRSPRNAAQHPKYFV
jgi:hypothetical protein